LISRNCTTGWSDWIHGELWLTDSALIRSKLSLRQTVENGLRPSVTVSTPTQPVLLPGYLARTRVVTAHRKNRYFSMTEISWAVLHRGVFTDRLRVTLDNGAKHKLLWPRADPASDVLCKVLRDVLKNRFIIE
jgi:hypothetical protein